jgi:hypothetical protein
MFLIDLNVRETLSFPLMEGYRVKKVLRSIFGPEREKKTRGRTKLYKAKVHNLHSSTSTMKEIN